MDIATNLVTLASQLISAYEKYQALGHELPEFYKAITRASRGLIAFEIDYNTTRTCANEFRMEGYQPISTSEIQNIEEFLTKFEDFLKKLPNPADPCSKKQRLWMAISGKAGSHFGGLPNQEQKLEGLMSELRSHHSCIKNKKQQGQQRSLLQENFPAVSRAVTHTDPRDPTSNPVVHIQIRSITRIECEK